MLLLGHIGITVFVASMLYLPIAFAGIGVLLPDIIDKGFFTLGIIPCARYLAHSVFFPPFAGLLVYLITRKWKFASAITLGSSLHLLQDATWFVPWFFPLINYPEIYSCGPLGVEFSMFVIITEIIGAGLLIFTLGFRQRFIYLRERFWNLVEKIKSVV